MNFIFYLSFFYVLGIILFFTRKYDIFTISLIYGMCGIFLWFGKIEMFLYLLLYFSFAEGITIILKNKHEKRTYVNLLGNCLVGTLLVVFGQIYASASTISSAFGDTFSSEIGRLSKKKPRLITTFKKVDAGTNGGITLFGILGAFFVSVLSFVLFFYIFKKPLVVSIIIGSFGVVGSLIDSVIGATLENKGYLDNAQTNFLTTFIVGIISFIVFSFI